MEPICHRCHGVVVEAMPYCQHCGAPQLIMNAYAQPLSSAIEAAELAAGHRPLGFTGTSRGLANSADWHAAVIAALQVSAVGAVLMVVSSLFPLSATLPLFWLCVAALLTVGLYHRKSPKALLNAGVGARIGIVVGLLLSSIWVSLNAVECVVYRFVMHQTYPLAAKIAESNQAAMNFYKTSGWFDADDLARLQQNLSYGLTPSGKVTYVLLGFASSSFFMLAFCLVTGAIGGKMLLRRQNAV